MKTRWPQLDAWARRLRWLAPAALLALVPKCGLCLLAYAGLASALGLGGRELCGGAGESPSLWTWWIALAAFAIGLAGSLLHRRRGAGRKITSD